MNNRVSFRDKKHNHTGPVLQAGMALIEMIAGCCVVGTLAAVTLNRHQAYQHIALNTTAQLTAAALASAANLKRAEWAVNPAMFAASSLKVNEQGVIMGLDNNIAASRADCSAIWEGLVISEAIVNNPPLLPTSDSVSVDPSFERYWSIATDGERCVYRYHHYQLPVVSVYYNTQTGEVSSL